MKTESIPHEPMKGLLATMAIQCTCPDAGTIGSFLFSGESWRNSGSRVTPVFHDLYEAYQWMQANGWEGVQSDEPTGRYRKL